MGGCPGQFVGPENTRGRDSILGEWWGRANQSPLWGHAAGGGDGLDLPRARAQALLSHSPEPCCPPSLSYHVSALPGPYLGHTASRRRNRGNGTQKLQSGGANTPATRGALRCCPAPPPAFRRGLAPALFATPLHGPRRRGHPPGVSPGCRGRQARWRRLF